MTRLALTRLGFAATVSAGIFQFGLTANSQIPAFPGALGFGANATGGRGGTVYHVTTLADSGPGSFRDAVSHSGRIVVFDVGGYITLNTAVSVQGDITIAGQTAPGGGIGFRGGEISFANRSNIICRYIRIRPGSETYSTSDDCLSLYRAQNVILDHVSMEFGPWNNVDAVSDDWQNHPVTDVTFQNCLNADPTGQQFGAHTESVSSSMSWFGNIFANSHNRNPLAKIHTVFINNVDYNCSAGYTTHTSTSFKHDIIGNYFIAGPASGSNFPWYQVDKNQSIFYTNNYYDANRNTALDGGVTTPYWYQGPGTILDLPWSPVSTSVPIHSAASAYRIAVSQAGALPRDQVDALVIHQIQTLGNGPTGTGAGTAGPDGGLYTSQTQTGLGNNGYGVIAGGIAPDDSDGDGMPDYWEKSVGLNYLNAGDAMTVATDGYENIEHYLNWLAEPHAKTSTNAPVEVNLWQYTGGFTNVNPVYTVGDAQNGSVTLTNGHLANFTPVTDFSGMASFRFIVAGSDGTTYTNTVSILVTPEEQRFALDLIWQGDGVSNLWAVDDGTNWLDGSDLVPFSTGDSVTFNDTGANMPAINVSGTLSPGGINVVADEDYTFGGSGSLAGPAGLFKGGAGTLFINTMNTFNGGAKIADGTIQLGDGVTANGNLSGNITNNGALVFDNPGPVSSAVSISGSGELTKSGLGDLTLTGTQTYTNRTTINAGSLEFSGSVPPGDIINNGSLVLTPSGSPMLANNISGSGTVTVGASLTLSGNNTYSGDTTNDSATLQIANDHAPGGGTVVYLGGAVKVGPGVVVTNNFSMPGGSTTDLSMDTYGGGTAVWAGDIINMSGGASWRPGGTDGHLMFTGHAIQGGRNFIVPKGALYIASNAVVSATGSATSFCRNKTHNSAFVTVQDNATVSVGAISLGGGQASGGRMSLTILDNASFSAATFDLHNSTASSAISIVELDGGTLTVNGFVKTRTGSGQLSTLNLNGGTLQAGSDNDLFLPALTGLSALVQSGGAIIDDGGHAVTVSQPLVHDSALGSALDGGLTKRGAGTLTLAGLNTFSGPTRVEKGTLALGGGSIFDSTGLSVFAGATFDASRIPAAFPVAAGHFLSGAGTILGNASAANGATIAPGDNGPGTLTISGNFSSGSSTAFQFELGTNSDRIAVTGSFFGSGILNITNVSGFGPGTYALFDYNASEPFTLGNFTIGSAPNGFSCTLSTNTPGHVDLIVSSLAPPGFDVPKLLGENLILSGSGGTPGGVYYVLTSTNLVLTPDQWTPVATNQFDSDGTFTITNALNSQAGPQFYRLAFP